MSCKEISRREWLKKSLRVSGGAAAFLSLEDRALLARESAGTTANAKETGEALAQGKIGPLSVSRIICGGNLIGGFAHSRDLVYVSGLLRQYFTDEKVFETLQLCEQNGVNTAILRLDSHTLRLIATYWKERGGKMQWIAQIKPKTTDLTTDAQRAIDAGACGVYVQGGVGDRFFKGGHVDLLGKFVEFAKRNKVVGGIGAHSIEVPVACEGVGIDTDFYMKTLHHGKYWSRGFEKEHDNVWSRTPERTIEFMQGVKKPWIAFKVLAAGAISPTSGFKYAFGNGADFACVGMFDFQIRDDIRIAKGLFSRGIRRRRPWCG